MNVLEVCKNERLSAAHAKIQHAHIQCDMYNILNCCKAVYCPTVMTRVRFEEKKSFNQYK